MYARDFKLIIPVFEDLRISLTSCKTENDNWLTYEKGKLCFPEMQICSFFAQKEHFFVPRLCK